MRVYSDTDTIIDILEHNRDFVGNFTIEHKAFFATNGEISRYDVDLIAGRCGYPSAGYGCFNQTTVELEDSVYHVTWQSSTTCD